MNEQLQKALQLLLRGQDDDSVNHFFNALCGPGECVRVDLIRGIVRIHDEEEGTEIRVVEFAISIEEKS
ncbi:MAG: hypothetical protein DRQ39_05965 [Gammaproteobacteria bacterium]|nr:MAG: hypothetical protein DRQ39_05965 [Gammaproteobacteria bacterium]